MCGIIGFKNSSKEDAVGLYPQLTHRGTDSIGLVGQNLNGAITQVDKIVVESKTNSLWKGYTKTKYSYGYSTSPSDVEWEEALTEFMQDKVNDYTILHNRWASIGASDDIAGAHPIFESDNKESAIVIHNGTNRDLYDSVKHIVDSDTQAICWYANQFKNIEAMADLLHKIGVVFIFKDNKLFFHRDAERPLFIDEERNIFASEPVHKGKWFLVDEQDTIFENLKDFMENVKASKEVVVGDKWVLKKCDKCNKKHYHNIGQYCLKCEAEGLKPLPITKSTSKTSFGKQWKGKTVVHHAMYHFIGNDTEWETLVYFENGKWYDISPWGKGKVEVGVSSWDELQTIPLGVFNGAKVTLAHPELKKYKVNSKVIKVDETIKTHTGLMYKSDDNSWYTFVVLPNQKEARELLVTNFYQEIN